MTTLPSDDDAPKAKALTDQETFEQLLLSLRVHAPKLSDAERVGIASDVTLKGGALRLGELPPATAALLNDLGDVLEALGVHGDLKSVNCGAWARKARAATGNLPAGNEKMVHEARTFELRAEAVACIWECLLEWKETRPELLYPLWEEKGTVDMRHRAIDLADFVLDVYDALGGNNAINDLDLVPYDWEFVPAVLGLIDWKAFGTRPTVEEAVKLLRRPRAERELPKKPLTGFR